MPPKKRKTARASTTTSPDTSMWLLLYEQEGYGETEREEGLYSTKEKAIAALPTFMDNFAGYGDDWKGGVEGFGKEDDDDYLGFEYFGKEVLKKSNTTGGILITNRNCDGRRNTITVRVKRMLIDLPDSKIEREEAPTLPTELGDCW